MDTKIAFAGLGTMGYFMASHIKGCTVWNRTHSKAVDHAKEYGTTAVEGLDTLKDAGVTVVVTCFPTSTQVADVAAKLKAILPAGSLLIDCTSGDPDGSKEIAASLKEANIDFVDAPVSGGPTGAKAGKLTVMCGAAEQAIFDRAAKVISNFGAKVELMGPVGSGDAVKAINNALNASHLALAGEGLLALTKAGIAPSKALSVINASSGRSLQTEKQIPDNVLTGKFAFGFQLGLMTKDVGIANKILDAHFPEATLFRESNRIYQAGMAEFGYGADTTEIIKYLEAKAGAELRD